MIAATLAETLGLQTTYIAYTMKVNLEGLSDDDALRQPGDAGNCVNWIVGHLLRARVGLIELLGQEPPFPPGRYQRYERSSGPVTASSGTVPLSEMVADLATTGRPLQAGLAALTDEMVSGEAPSFPGTKPGTTLGSLLAGLVFHEAYHAGQLGLLRRIGGREGAIK